MTPYARHIARLEEIPPELRALPIWCAWELVRLPGKKPAKQPVSPITGRKDGWTAPGFCSDAEAAIHYAEANKNANGVGIVLMPEYGIAGGDLDNCRDASTGGANSAAAKILYEADTYAEVSPGLAGFRFFFRGDFGRHTGNDRARGVEFYEDRRFLTFTGNHVESTPFAVEQRDLAELGKKHFPEKAVTVGAVAMPSDWQPVDLDALGLTDYTKRLIRDGKPAGERSEHVYGAIKDLIRAGCDDPAVCRVLTDPSNGLSTAALERRGNVISAMQWIGSQIPKARAEVAKEKEVDISGIIGNADQPFSLSMFALNGRSEEMRKQMLDDKFILGRLAILGQATVFYASRNAGKTLITLRLLIDAIQSGEIDGKNVFYINADDNFKGLTVKLALAERYGFNMLAPGHNGFESEMLTRYMEKMIEAGTARGSIIILDTLKKFADVMDKKRSTDFGRHMREFVLHGGSVVSLAHVNKHRDTDGKVIFSGTSDIPDDVDAVYTADVIEDIAGARTVLFENTKNRGDNAQTASYSYTRTEGQPYEALLDSVRSVSEAEAEEAKRVKEVADRLSANRGLIEAITEALEEGLCLRTEIIAAVHDRTGESKKRVTKALDEHTGDSMLQGHRWMCERGAKNARVYKLIDLCFSGKLENWAHTGKHGKHEKLNGIQLAA